MTEDEIAGWHHRLNENEFEYLQNGLVGSPCSAGNSQESSPSCYVPGRLISPTLAAC